MTLAEIIAEVSPLEMVERATIWDGRRVYVQIAGRNNSFPGDRNAKVWWDKSGWHIEGMKGNRSAAFGKNLQAFAAIYCRSAFWRE